MSDDISVLVLRQLLDYDPETGALTWRPRPDYAFKNGNASTWNKRFAGKPALAAQKDDGYLCGAIHYRNYPAHRVCWAIHYGAWPERFIRHRNGIRSDNRIANLFQVEDEGYCKPSLGISQPEQFFSHFDDKIIPISESGCWVWTGTLTDTGYGEVKVSGIKSLAHRIAYTCAKGLIPEGMMVRHSCDIPCCVNPNHLSVGSQMDNMDDMKSRSRQSRGTHRPKAKLSDSDVVEIRRLIARGVPQSSIASRFGVSQPRISKINTGKIWSHVQ